jgi:tetratricopeptide (TPR) repeat protein
MKLGSLLADRGDYQEAEPMLREALDIQQRALTRGHSDIATTQSFLGRCLVALARYDEAKVFLVESYATLKDQRGNQDEYTQKALKRLVDLYDAWGKPDDAARYRMLLEPISSPH